LLLAVIRALRYVEQLVQQEVDHGLASSQVVVAGFSQGGVIALHMLRSSFKLAGIAGRSAVSKLKK
jgi:predicted esterase